MRAAAASPTTTVPATAPVRERRRRERTRARDRQLALVAATAREEEARRIGQELHDGASQLVVALHLALADLGRRLPQIHEDVQRLRGRVDELEERLRSVSHALKPALLEAEGLDAAIQALAADATVRWSVPVTVQGAVGGRLPAVLESALYRVVQESVANALRHARARHVAIRLHRGPHGLHLGVRDDGVGFDVPTVLARPAREGLGLLGIHERVDAVGGAFLIQSWPGAGTVLSVTIPLGGPHVAHRSPRR